MTLRLLWVRQTRDVDDNPGDRVGRSTPYLFASLVPGYRDLKSLRLQGP